MVEESMLDLLFKEVPTAMLYRPELLGAQHG